MEYLLQWFVAFLLTQALEIPVAAWVLKGGPLWRRVGIAFFATLATHPAVWFIYPTVFDSPGGEQYGLSILVSETWAVVLESLLYFLAFPDLGWRRAVAAGVLANGFSYAVGLVLQHFNVI